MKKILWRSCIVILCSSLLVAALAYNQLHNYLDSPLVIPDAGLDITLEQGGSLGTLVYSLASKGRLDYPKIFLLYSRLTGRGQVVAAGEYFLLKGITPRLLLDKLESGDVRFYQLTLIEGWNLRQVLSAMRSETKLKHLIPKATDNITLDILGIESEVSNPEGLFFPDTYRFQRNTSDIELLKQAYDRLQSILMSEWASRSDNLPYKTPYEALIMASLIEKETGLASERDQISGVFYRRLKKGMRLQTDPTIIYGLGKDFDGNLKSIHLKDSSNIYNTYRHGGLPPTPIALVGREAIYAALNPEKGDALYFVAKGDGSHYFSKTLEEHRIAVKKYQIDHRKKNYTSTAVKK